MARDEDTFRIRPGKVRDRGGTHSPRTMRQRPATFIGEVHRAIRRSGGNPHRLAGKGKASGRFNARGRGAAAAAGLKGRNGWSRSLTGGRTRSRRVAVKARVVKLNPQRGASRGRQFVTAKAVDAHLRYLERDGVTRDGEKGRVYSADHDIADGGAFLDRGREDRHQFRFIVSAEEGVELSDLRATTRDLMKQMETDLGTGLDWIAVDHHNTGHPHTHILLRGVTEQGKALNIAGDYIAHGIRARASEIVTLELGRQTEQEVTRQLEREVDADRFTRLDRMLIAEGQAGNEFADLRPDKDMAETMRRNRALLIDRARKLERMGLAAEVTPGRWTLSSRAEPTLRELGIRGDIVKTVHRALATSGLATQRDSAHYVLHRSNLAEPVVGRVLTKGLGADEMGERMHLVIDGVDGRIHHLEIDTARAEEIDRGMIVRATPPPRTVRVADRNILAVTDADGIYSPAAHLKAVRERGAELRTDPETFVRGHVRRLEALRRAGIVERVHAEHWTIPADLPERGLAHDLAKDGDSTRIATLSPIRLDRQVRHDGATWLDRQLVARQRIPLAAHGFGAEVSVAMEQRKRSLVAMGLATDLGDGRFRAPRDLLQNLERGEIERAGRLLAVEHGRSWKPAKPGEYVTGTLVGSTNLASGRFAMIDDGMGFSLVPWSNPLEKRLGQHISGVSMSGGGVDWSFARQRGLGL